VLPDIAILGRPPLRSGGGYAFDPFTLIMRGPRDFAPDAKLDPVEDSAAQQAFLHEDLHWLQSVGTSVGLFLTAVRFSQEQTAGLLRDLPPHLRRQLRDGRVSTPAVPIAQVDRAGALVGGSSRGSQPLGSLVQGWYDHLATHRLFADSQIVDGVAWDLPVGLTETFCDIASTLHLMGVSSSYDYQEHRQRLRFSDLGRRVGNADRVTTTLILESAATVDELLTAVMMARKSPGSGEALVEAIVRRLRGGTYGAALRHFARLVHADTEAGFADLFTFGLVCDIALNPPLPPVTPASEMPLSWDELYPPIRFLRACGAVKALSIQLDAGSEHRDYVELRESVCAAASMTIADGGWANLDSYQQVDWPALFTAPPGEPPGPSGGIPENNGYLDFLLWCGARARELRAHDIRLLLHPGFRISLRDPQAIALRFEEQGGGWYRAPAWSLGDRFAFSEPLRSWFGTWLITKAVWGASIHDWMAGTGPLDLRSLPREIRDDQAEVWEPGIDRLLDL
jgi:hypothetical protein